MSNRIASALWALRRRHRLRHLQGRIVTGCVVLAIASLLAASDAAAQATLATAVTSRDPKLSSILVELREAVPQVHAGEGDDRAALVSSFSASKLPRSIRDAVLAGSMHLSAKAQVQVDIQMSSLGEENLAALRELGVTIEIQAEPKATSGSGRVFSRIPVVQAEVPVESLQLIEELPFVRFIHLPYYAMSNGSSGASPGSLTTQGDAILRALALRTSLNVTGAGVRVGVISTGIGGLFQSGNCTTTCPPVALSGATASPILTGDLPGGVASFGTRNTNSPPALTAVSADVLFAAKSFRSIDDDLGDSADGKYGAEGSAMLEIIHHLAPGASLSFANADTDLEFETAVNYLASQNDVVVDDMSFLAPSYDGTSDVSQNTTQALNNPANPIRAYITVAGNYALNHYSGTWSDSKVDGTQYTGEGGDLHQFSGMPPGTAIPSQDTVTQLSTATIDNLDLGNQVSDPLISLGPLDTVMVGLSWNDRPGASVDDFDLFLVPVNCATTSAITTCTLTGPPVTYSKNRQTGFQDPYEYLTYTNPGPADQTLAVVIQNYNNTADISTTSTFDMFIIGNGAKGTQPNHNYYTISGSIPAQADAAGNVITVGAINQVQCDATPSLATPDNCIQQLEPFTGEGPTQTTPQVSTGAMKPNLTAVDEVCITGAGGYGNAVPTTGVSCPVSGGFTYTPMLFGGTSAAAAHIAAIAALTLQMAPCLETSFGSQTAAAAVFARQTLYTALTGLPTTITGTGATAVTTPAVQYASVLSGYDLPITTVTTTTTTTTGSTTTTTTTFPFGVPNNAEGWGLVDAFSSASSLLPVPTAQNILAVSATQADPDLIASISAISLSGATVTLTSPTKLTNVSGCPTTNMEWAPQPGSMSTLVSNSAQGTQATVPFPIGITPVVIAPSINNGVTYPPLNIVPAANVVVTDFNLTVQSSTPAPVIVPAGTPAVFIVTATSLPTGPFANPVSLSCQLTGLPPGAMCVFSPAVITPSVTSSGGTTQMATSTLTIYTSGVVASAPRSGGSSSARPPSTQLLCGLVMMFGLFGLLARRGGFHLRWLALGFIAIVTCLGISSCGTQASSAPNSTKYTVIVAGTSDQLVHTVPVMFTVQ